MAGAISTIVLSDGTKRYRARYRDAGGRQHEKRYKRKVDAQHWLDEQTSALVTQTWTAPERGRITVEAWAQQWLAAQNGLKPSTSYRYRSLLRSQVLPRWGRHRLADVSHADVAAWVADMTTGGLAPATVRQAHRVLALVLTLAVRDGRIPRNPATGVPLPRAVRAEPRFLTREQVEQLADAAAEYGDVVRLLAYTGLRFGELAALRVRRIDFLRKAADRRRERHGGRGSSRVRQPEDPPAADRPHSCRAPRAPGAAVRRQARRRPRPDLT
jgi:integrase